MKVKPHLILREKGLNPDFKLKGGSFDNTLLNLLNEFYYSKVLGFEIGKKVKVAEIDPRDDFYGIPVDKRWSIGEEFTIKRIDYLVYGIFLVDEENHTLSIERAELVSYEN
jgi:hypothetical protein